MSHSLYVDVFRFPDHDVIYREWSLEKGDRVAHQNYISIEFHFYNAFLILTLVLCRLYLKQIVSKHFGIFKLCLLQLGDDLCEISKGKCLLNLKHILFSFTLNLRLLFELK